MNNRGSLQGIRLLADSTAALRLVQFVRQPIRDIVPYVEGGHGNDTIQPETELRSPTGMAWYDLDDQDLYGQNLLEGAEGNDTIDGGGGNDTA